MIWQRYRLNIPYSLLNVNRRDFVRYTHPHLDGDCPKKSRSKGKAGY